MEKVKVKLKLFYSRHENFENFGNQISYELVKRIVPNLQAMTPLNKRNERKFLANNTFRTRRRLNLGIGFVG